MMTRRIVPSLVALAVVPAAAVAWQQHRTQGPREAQREVVTSPLGSDAQLRACGPEGLTTLLAAYDKAKDVGLLPRIDAVAAQHDAVWSRLYWYTDLGQAKAAAKAEQKPILYLRLMGRLTDEYSCANSRFFRTVLYANDSVSKLMREKFVLVWESERPVPQVTIDYGDGRVLKRTLTGNSIHYVLDADGRVVDALPGLYDPATFAAVLTSAIDPAISGAAQTKAVHVEDALRTTAQEVERDMKVLQVLSGPGPVPAVTRSTAAAAEDTVVAKRRVETQVLTSVESDRASRAPGAGAAAETTEAKREVERPIVKTVVPGPRAPDAAQASQRAVGKTMVERPLVAVTTRPTTVGADDWERLGELHAASVRLDERSTALMRSHNPAYADPAVFARATEQFRRAIAQDTARNQYDFRTRILGWLKQTPGIALETLNARVYSELFLTPRSDPWLGLRSDDVYSALPDDGCVLK